MDLERIRAMGQRDGTTELARLYPQHSRRWYVRHWKKLTALDGPTFRRAVTHPAGYADPTGERAAYLADRAA